MSQLNVGTVNATNITATGEVDADTKLKIPQKTTAQLPTSGVVAGEMVQNTTTNKTMVYNGTQWVNTEGEGRQYKIQCWGAGGGGGRAGGWSYGAEGGGGGYVEADISGLASNTNLVIRVGEGGLVNGTRMSYGGGGQANRDGGDNRYGSNGGGASAVFITSASHSNVLIIAGGGGGGGSSRNQEGNWGGAGGGVTGQDGSSPYEYKIQYRGRAGSAHEGGRNAQDGTSYSARALEGGTPNSNCYGGAGGGGYYGGGAGGYSESNTMGGGGGGSGYTNPTYCTNVRNHRGEARMPAGAGEDGYPGSGISVGGDSNAAAGGHGYIRITDSAGSVTAYSYTGSDVSITVP